MNAKQSETNSVRRQALASQNRAYWVHLLSTVDTWWPVYRVRHPNADQKEVVTRLATLVDEHRRRGFTKGDVGVKQVPDSALSFDAARTRRPLPDFGLASQSGTALAHDFKWYDVEAAGKSDTVDQHLVEPLGSPGWQGAHGANFWAGFARLDSTWDQIDIFDASPSDRVVHMAVLRIPLPKPTFRVLASLQASVLVTLPLGLEIINDWGFFDDKDSASFKLDVCGALTRQGSAFPDPQAFGFNAAISRGSSTHSALRAELNLSRNVVLLAGDAPSLFLGIRLTIEGADSRIQTGFTQAAPTASFSFHPPNSSSPGVFYSYTPELVVAANP